MHTPGAEHTLASGIPPPETRLCGRSETELAGEREAFSDAEHRTVDPFFS